MSVKNKTAAKCGRPSTFTNHVATTICNRLSSGESLREICDCNGMPSKETVRNWLRDNNEFLAQYAQARRDQMDHYAEEILDIANDGRNDWEVRENHRTGSEFTVLNSEAVARSRLRVDTIKWLMSKLAPKKYGEKIEVEQSGNLDIKIKIGGPDGD